MKSKEKSIENNYLMRIKSNKNIKWEGSFNLNRSPINLPNLKLARSISISPNLKLRKFSDIKNAEINDITEKKLFRTFLSDKSDFTKEYDSGDKYEGELHQGEPHGSGYYVYANGDSYKGEFQNGDKNGNGIEIFRKGDLIITSRGTFKNNLLNGKGVLKICQERKDIELSNECENKEDDTLENISLYKGEFKDNKKEGYGIYETLGQIYLGQFLLNEKNGKCMIYTSNKSIYRGEIKNGKKHGFGSYQFTNGGSFVGEFNNGEKTGIGIAYYNNGDHYIGNFKNGKREGIGIYENKNGWSYNGEFSNGRSNGRGFIKYISGDIYEGQFLDGKKHGFGIYYFSSGDVYVGEFKDNNFEGFGEYTKNQENVRIYKGFFKEGKKHGKGFYYSPFMKESKINVEYKKGKRLMYCGNNTENNLISL